jgi:hypothetical protein
VLCSYGANVPERLCLFNGVPELIWRKGAQSRSFSFSRLPNSLDLNLPKSLEGVKFFSVCTRPVCPDWRWTMSAFLASSRERSGRSAAAHGIGPRRCAHPSKAQHTPSTGGERMVSGPPRGPGPEAGSRLGRIQGRLGGRRGRYRQVGCCHAGSRLGLLPMSSWPLILAHGAQHFSITLL